MSLSLDQNNSSYQVRAYKPGFIQVNENIYTNSLIITPSQVINDWPPESLSELTAEHLHIILELSPAILLIGTGEHLSFPNIEIYGELYNHGIGIEIMDTSAAARTFNALASENRNVVAALIIK